MKKNKKKVITTSLLLLLFALSLIQTRTIKNNFTNENNQYSYTTAICNKQNYCEDYYIECKKNKPTKISPTGFSIQQNIDWKDTRPQKEFCQ